MGAPRSSTPPAFVRSSFQLVTSAAIERTLARGPMVAARRGIAVDANHHDLVVEHQHLEVLKKPWATEVLWKTY